MATMTAETAQEVAAAREANIAWAWREKTIGLSFGVADDGDRYLILDRQYAAVPDVIGRTVAEMRAKAAKWADSTAASVQSENTYPDSEKNNELLAGNRRAFAAKINEWLALPGNIQIGCPWRGCGYIVPVSHPA